jgi:hypothetical protein
MDLKLLDITLENFCNRPPIPARRMRLSIQRLTSKALFAAFRESDCKLFISC